MQRVLGGLALALLFVAPLAHADQCQLVDPGVASRAVAAIHASHGRLLAHCGPCGDPDPVLGAAFVPRDVHSAGTSVIVDGREVDLAYLYLEVRPNTFENVALRTGCPALDVAQTWIFQPTRVRRAGFGPISPQLRAVGWGYTAPRQQRVPLPG